jgi:hypothetical protein
MEFFEPLATDQAFVLPNRLQHIQGLETLYSAKITMAIVAMIFKKIK